MTSSQVKITLFPLMLVVMLCSSSAAIDPSTGAFNFRIEPVYQPFPVLAGYSYVLDPNEVSEYRGNIEYDRSRLSQFNPGAPAPGGFENLHGLQTFVVQDTFSVQGNVIENVHGISGNGTHQDAVSGDILQVTFDLISQNDPGPAPTIRFFSDDPSHFIAMDGITLTNFNIVSVPEPTACSLLLLGFVCLGPRFRRCRRRM